MNTQALEVWDGAGDRWPWGMGPALLVSHVPVRSNKQAKNSEVRSSLPGCHGDTFVEVGG